MFAPAVAAPPLLARLKLGTTAVGLFVALVYLAAMFASPLGAALVKRFGPIRASQIALVLGAAGLALLCAPSVPAAMLGSLLIGAGYGPITPASSQMLSRTTDPRNYSLVFSIKQTGVPLGGVIAGVMVPPLVLIGGAPLALAGVAALCVIGLIAAQPLSAALDDGRDRASPWPTMGKLMAPVRFVATHPVLRSVALCSFVFSMVQVSFTSYVVSWLNTDLRWTLVAAGAALSASQVAGMVGRITWGVAADRWLGPRRMLLALAALMGVCGLVMPAFGSGSAPIVVTALLCLYGATAVGWNGVYLATVARLVPQPQAAEATAGTLFFTFFGVVIGPPLFGAAGSAFGALGPAFALLALPIAFAAVVLARSRWGL